jgi:hypothetical protein
VRFRAWIIAAIPRLALPDLRALWSRVRDDATPAGDVRAAVTFGCPVASWFLLTS